MRPFRISCCLLSIAMGVLAQKLVIVQEYQTHAELRDVIVVSRDNTLTPVRAVADGKITSFSDSTSRCETFHAIYTNRNHTKCVLYRVKRNVGQEASLIDRKNIPLYFLPDIWEYAGYVKLRGQILSFYDPNKQFLRDFDLPIPTVKMDASKLGAFSKKGEYFVFYYPVSKLDREGGASDLFYFTGSGRKLWERQTPLLKINSLGIAPKGDVIVISGILSGFDGAKNYPNTLILNRESQIIDNYPFEFEQYDFSDNSQYLILGKANRARLIDIPRKEIIFDWSFEESKVITDVKLIDLRYLLLVVGERKDIEGTLAYSDPIVYLFDLRGNLLDQMSFKEELTYKGLIIAGEPQNLFGIVLGKRFVVLEVKE